MTDRVLPKQRSEVMRRVRSKNSSLEWKVRSALHKRGFRYRLHYTLPGKPDIVFIRARLVVFIDSCFWHGCPQHLRMPKSNKQYWIKKINRNIKRDAEIDIYYQCSNWKQIRIWEHELKDNLDGCLERIEKAIRSKYNVKVNDKIPST